MKARLIIILILLIPIYVDQGTGQEALEPLSLDISGDIVDNYANLTYTLDFDNTGSETDTLLQYSLATPTSLYLSNVSVTMDDLQFWGEVNPISIAQQIFNDSISANKSAVLVKALGDTYSFKINVKAGKFLILKAYFEGYLTRKLGTYDLSIFRNLGISYTLDLNIDINIKTGFSSIILARFSNLVGYDRTLITEGKKLSFSSLNYILDHDISLSYTMSKLEEGGKIITHSNGTDNFFAYLFAPEIQTYSDKEPREYIFVLDISGSMGDGKLEQAKNAFVVMIETLDSSDMLNVIVFDTNSEKLWTTSRTASFTNVNIAVAWVQALKTKSSTNINDALLDAMNSFVGELTAKVVVFLSDGVPSAGVRTTPDIVNNVRNANTHEAKIFSIAFGQSTEEGLMAALAYDNGGLFALIEHDDLAILKLDAFYSEFALPVALGVAIAYSEAFDVYPGTALLKGAIFNGTEILQTGRFTSSSLSVSTTLFSSYGNKPYSLQVTTVDNNNPHIERLWAQNSVNQLLKMLTITPNDPGLKKQLVDLAVEYGLVVPGYTGLTVVVEESVIETTTVTTENALLTTPSPPIATVITTISDQLSDVVTTGTSIDQSTTSDLGANVDDVQDTVTEKGDDVVSNVTEQSPGFTLWLSLISLITLVVFATKRKRLQK